MTNFIPITLDYKDAYNASVLHPLQSYEWGEFREKTGVTVVRRGRGTTKKITDGFTVTIHKIPKTPFTIGYFPKGMIPSIEILEELQKIGKEYNCIFIQLEPNIIKNQELRIKNKEDSVETLIHNSKFKILPSFRPLFTRYTFMLDLTKSEDELLSGMHPKTRYNIKVAQKKGVWVEEDNSEEGFREYLHLTENTTKRQKFYAHTPSYHRKQWETLPKNTEPNELSYHLIHARYKDDAGKTHTLTSWVLFIFKDTLYYPYGASSTEFRNTMSSNLVMWEAIQFGKKLQLENFDMWGALGPDPDPKDPWYGFHKFKMGYGATLTEFVGSYNVVTNPALYHFYAVADWTRWFLLRLKRSIT